MTDIKPCPFCGGKAKYDKDWNAVVCTSCGAGTRHSILVTIKRKEAIEAWNSRSDPWHTGTPIEEGWYLLAVKHGEKIHYNANRLYSGGEWFYSKLGEVLAYQKIESYKEKKDG